MTMLIKQHLICDKEFIVEMGLFDDKQENFL